LYALLVLILQKIHTSKHKDQQNLAGVTPENTVTRTSLPYFVAPCIFSHSCMVRTCGLCFCPGADAEERRKSCQTYATKQLLD
jgi:hypothetical protein